MGALRRYIKQCFTMGLNKFCRNKQGSLKKDTRTCSIRSMAEETLGIFGVGKEWKEKKVEQRKDERRNAGLSVKTRRGKKRQ